MSFLTDALGIAPTRPNRTAFGAGLHRRYAQWRTYRRTRDELQSLSDRELADLGLHRSTIGQVAMEAAYGEA